MYAAQKSSNAAAWLHPAFPAAPQTTTSALEASNDLVSKNNINHIGKNIICRPKALEALEYSYSAIGLRKRNQNWRVGKAGAWQTTKR